MTKDLDNKRIFSREALTDAFSLALKEKFALQLKEKEILDPEIIWTYPPSFEMGDLSTNVALSYAAKLKMNPRELAEFLVEKVQSKFSKDEIEFSIAGPGFINVKYDKSTLKKLLDDVKYSKSDLLKLLDNLLINFENLKEYSGNEINAKNERVMIEFTDPNPFKQFHIGHLMSNTIGESLARLTEVQGERVVRANYQGDVGPHVAKAIYGMQSFRHEMPAEDAPLSVKTSFLGKAYQYGAQQYEENAEAKTAIQDLNAKIYQKSDEDVMSLYKIGRSWSLAHFEEMYEVLGTHFDQYFFEMDVFEKGVAIVHEWEKKGVFEKSEGAYVYHGEKDGLHTRVFITSQGFPTYEAKELGLMFEKKSHEPELSRSLVITGNEQDEYYRVVLSAMKHIDPEIAGMTEHMSHGMMRFVGGKMSSRKGNVITGESLLEDMTTLALERMERTCTGDEALDKKKAQQIAVASIKYFILRQDIGKDIIFDPEQALSFEGDSGPYLQYTYARTCSLLRKARELGPDPEIKIIRDISPLDQLLVRFSDVVERSASERAPHHLAHYVTEVARAFNHWYGEEKIFVPGEKNFAYNMFIVEVTRNVIAKSLYLLGIHAPEEM